MPRKGDPKFIPLQGKGAGPALMPFDQIPDDIKTEAEEIYAALKANDGRMKVEFDTKQEVDEYANLLTSYCLQRPAELGGPIRFRRSPVKGQAENVMDFRITDPLPEKSEETTTNASETAPVEASPKSRSRKGAA
jgi:hypothetical protein